MLHPPRPRQPPGGGCCTDSEEEEKARTEEEEERGGGGSTGEESRNCFDSRQFVPVCFFCSDFRFRLHPSSLSIFQYYLFLLSSSILLSSFFCFCSNYLALIVFGYFGFASFFCASFFLFFISCLFFPSFFFFRF